MGIPRLDRTGTGGGEPGPIVTARTIHGPVRFTPSWNGLTGGVAYVIDPTLPTGDEVRRVVGERLEDAIEVLDRVIEGRHDDVESAVHDVRKRCKETRGAGRLVRPALADEWRRFDRLVRDAAGQLSELRDAHALLATFDALLGSVGDDERLHTGRDRQASLAAEATAALTGGDARIVAARALLADAEQASRSWALGAGFGTIGDGLTAVYRTGRRTLRTAETDPTDHDVHEWRKAVKYLWYQTRLLRDVAPSIIVPIVDALDDMGEALGDDHDLAVLVAQLDADPDRFGDVDAVGHARDLARTQQEVLRERAFRAGAAVYAETPSEFRRRIRRLWRVAQRRGPERRVGGIAALSPRADRPAPPAPPSDAATAVSTVERERKYLVAVVPDGLDLSDRVELRQGYLVTGPVSVRVRDAGPEGCTLTAKGGSSGTARTEIEVPIDRAQFDAAWALTEGARVAKTRHRIPAGPHVIELDVFGGDHAGLVVAEVEFDSTEALDAFEPPSWFGLEVSDDERYTNASLARHGLPLT
jgi:CYTH domain-containing protein/CHAD domain-containing protein